MSHQLIAFAILSIPTLYFSRKPLQDIHNHGFSRFFGWECILWIIISNARYWFSNPFSINQLFSWALLIISIYYAIGGGFRLLRTGKAQPGREDTALYDFEKTTRLVDTGIYKFIRHPLYASLIIFAWGVYLKNTTILLFFITLAASVFLYITSKIDEKECLDYFGNDYKEYIKRSKMFIPFVF